MATAEHAAAVKSLNKSPGRRRFVVSSSISLAFILSNAKKKKKDFYLFKLRNFGVCGTV